MNVVPALQLSFDDFNRRRIGSFVVDQRRGHTLVRERETTNRTS